MISNIFEEIKGVWHSRESWRFIWVDGRRFIFQGNHEDHILLFTGGVWQCDCKAWQTRAATRRDAWCWHTEELRRVLVAMDNSAALMLQGELVH
jgi:hypothetical protein